jgi:class 3 adenylate cyclase
MSGAPLPRGTVTFLFSDMEGSTDLVRRVGEDVFAGIRADHRGLLRHAFEAHGGREIDTAGDGFFVAFDSARSAVTAAITAQLALATCVWPEDAEVRVRMGLHTAEPHLASDGYVGLGVNRAARICDAAHGGQILVSNATAGIVEDAELPGVELVDLGAHRLKGLPREQRLFQLSAHGLPAQFDRLRTPEADAQVPGVGTFLATDLSRWRDVISSLGDEASAALAADNQAAMTAAVVSHNRIVLERGGDTVVAVFRNASDAVRAAIFIREAFADFAWPPECDVALSIMVHSGRWSGDPQQPAAGTAFLRLLRLEQIVDPGQVLVSESAAALLEGDRSLPALRYLGERVLSDMGEPTRIYELSGN